MNRCPITYEECGNDLYSKSGLAKLSPRLNQLKQLELSAEEQRREAMLRSDKMSIQGVQAKLSAKLSIKNECFELVDKSGTFIIKPQSDTYIQVPENEDLTMKMAGIFGIDVPLTGLLYCNDSSFSYFVKRFDRYGKGKKYQLEDFAQLTGNTRDTKYDWSMEKLLPVIDRYCTFPLLEKQKLLRRLIFCLITGNEDMHLKNFSLITHGPKVELSPAYDLLSTTLAMGRAVEELALPLDGKKKNISKKLLLDYFAQERMGLNPKIIRLELDNLKSKKSQLKQLINISFLIDSQKKKYHDLLEERISRFFLS